jgi:D-arabinono-1,4-lactone oxidase
MEKSVRGSVGRTDSDQLKLQLPRRTFANHLHSTWAQTFFCRPERYIQPENLDEIALAVNAARKLKKQIVVTGSGHSPSTLTCTSSWLMNLDHFNRVLHIDEKNCRITIEAGMRLFQLSEHLYNYGLAMPNLGSIDSQSIAGAISTGTHGSSLQYGLLSESILSLSIMLSNGNVVSCSKDHNKDLFEASLISLGALGIIVQVTFQAVRSFRVAWTQEMVPMQTVIEKWDTIWKSADYIRCWWLPYTRRMIVWRGDRSTTALRAPPSSWYAGKLGYYVYLNLLYVSTWIPRIVPWIEKFIFGMQYTFSSGPIASAVEESADGLKMDCLYHQFVNEWALPLERGPEAISRLQTWLEGDRSESNIPYDPRNVYVHAPIEVRVSDSSKAPIQPHLNPMSHSGPTLYINATLYRPYNIDPPGHQRWYEAFEYVMKQLDGRPHWAKNFLTVSPAELRAMYPRISEWIALRDGLDPDNVFVSDWLETTILEGVDRKSLPAKDASPQSPTRDLDLRSATSQESFDFMQTVEAEKSVLLPERE